MLDYIEVSNTISMSINLSGNRVRNKKLILGRTMENSNLNTVESSDFDMSKQISILSVLEEKVCGKDAYKFFITLKDYEDYEELLEPLDGFSIWSFINTIENLALYIEEYERESVVEKLLQDFHWANFDVFKDDTSDKELRACLEDFVVYAIEEQCIGLLISMLKRQVKSETDFTLLSEVIAELDNEEVFILVFLMRRPLDSLAALSSKDSQYAEKIRDRLQEPLESLDRNQFVEFAETVLETAEDEDLISALEELLEDLTED